MNAIEAVKSLCATVSDVAASATNDLPTRHYECICPTRGILDPNVHVSDDLIEYVYQAVHSRIGREVPWYECCHDDDLYPDPYTYNYTLNVKRWRERNP